MKILKLDLFGSDTIKENRVGFRLRNEQKLHHFCMELVFELKLARLIENCQRRSPPRIILNNSHRSLGIIRGNSQTKTELESSREAETVC